ncbi:hypothetical protein HB770_05270 [Rhizobium leguminosarum bv. viciae]|uniref:Transmembrane protein n=1 Tax=Rhizobium leguminosarum bv. viciae TaxID=387 RepID=A0A7G6RI45_RHILV|nr:hypothetical protein HB770_05270 [Rhizobium leguminosarum bv. viciae]
MQCDAFSAPYILLAIGCSLSLATGTALLAKQTFNVKLFGLALPTAFVAAATAILFPRCLSGPYWMIDPLSKADWLDRVGQEHSFVYFLQQGQFFIVFMLAVLACIAIMALLNRDWWGAQAACGYCDHVCHRRRKLRADAASDAKHTLRVRIYSTVLAACA